MTDTYWYFHASPTLMVGIADACQSLFDDATSTTVALVPAVVSHVGQGRGADCPSCPRQPPQQSETVAKPAPALRMDALKVISAQSRRSLQSVMILRRQKTYYERTYLPPTLEGHWDADDDLRSLTA